MSPCVMPTFILLSSIFQYIYIILDKNVPEVPTINLHPQITQITQIEIKTNLCNPRNLRMKVISLIRIHSYILFSLISSFTLLFRHAQWNLSSCLFITRHSQSVKRGFHLAHQITFQLIR